MLKGTANRFRYSGRSGEYANVRFYRDPLDKDGTQILTLDLLLTLARQASEKPDGPFGFWGEWPPAYAGAPGSQWFDFRGAKFERMRG